MQNITTPDGEIATPLLVLAIQQTGKKAGELVIIKKSHILKGELLAALEMFKKYIDGLPV